MYYLGHEMHPLRESNVRVNKAVISFVCYWCVIPRVSLLLRVLLLAGLGHKTRRI